MEPLLIAGTQYVSEYADSGFSLHFGCAFLFSSSAAGELEEMSEYTNKIWFPVQQMHCINI